VKDGETGETVAAAIARTARPMVETIMRLSMSYHARDFQKSGGIRRSFRNSEQAGWGLFRIIQRDGLSATLRRSARTETRHARLAG
jgi:hypothetical protein